MKCKNCNSSNLFLYSHSRPDKVRINSLKKKRYLVDPRINMDWKKDYHYFCYDCTEHGMFSELKDLTVRTSLLNQKKLVLDLDHTLICTYNKQHDLIDSWDFEFDLPHPMAPKARVYYQVKIRPHIKEFIKYAEERFDEIHICTAASADYAKEIIKGLGIADKITSITSRESLDLQRTLTDFDRDYIKRVENSIVLEDKPHVIWGQGNTVFALRCFWGEEDDTELLAVMDILKEKKNPRVIKNNWRPKMFNIMEDISNLIRENEDKPDEHLFLTQLPRMANNIRDLYVNDLVDKVFLEKEKNALISFLRRQNILAAALEKDSNKVFEIIERSDSENLKDHIFGQVVDIFIEKHRKDRFSFKNYDLIRHFMENKDKLKNISKRQIHDLKFIGSENNTIGKETKDFFDIIKKIETKD